MYEYGSIQDNVDAGANYLRSQLDATGGNAIDYWCIQRMVQGNDQELPVLSAREGEWAAAELGLFAGDIEWMVHWSRPLWRPVLDWYL